MRMMLLAAGFAFTAGTAAQARVPGAVAAEALHALAQAEVLPVKNDKYKYKWKGGGCKYEFKSDRKGYKEKYKCK
jgi:hypothetical protein